MPMPMAASAASANVPGSGVVEPVLLPKLSLTGVASAENGPTLGCDRRDDAEGPVKKGSAATDAKLLSGLPDASEASMMTVTGDVEVPPITRFPPGMRLTM